MTAAETAPQRPIWRVRPVRFDALTCSWLLLLATLFAAPIVRVGGLPIPLLFAASGLLLVARPLRLGDRTVWALSGLAAAYLLIASLGNRTYNPLLGFKDVLYFVIPVQFLLGMALFNTILRKNPALRTVFVTFCKVFLVLQLAAVLVELANVGPILSVIKPYIRWFLLNTSSTDLQLDYINIRPSGTLGNPVMLGLIGYIVGRFISWVDRRPVFLVLGIALIILTSSRAAMVAIVLAEGVAAFIQPPGFFRDLAFRVTPKRLALILAAAGLLMGLLVVTFLTVPFMRAYLVALQSGGLGNVSDDYSIAYRNEVLAWGLSQPERLLVGGLSLAEAPEYIDSEILMRSLQFGILGYLALQTPVWSIAILGRRLKSASLVRFGVALLIFCFVCSITFSPFSNPYFVVWYAAIAGYAASLIGSPEKPGAQA